LPTPGVPLVQTTGIAAHSEISILHLAVVNALYMSRSANDAMKKVAIEIIETICLSKGQLD
jgi:hypothetical protein